MATTTGIAAQGISAAIVLTAINKISGMINTADAAMQAAISSQINEALHSIPGRPDAMNVNYAEKYSDAHSALSGADLKGPATDIQAMPLFLDNVVGSFFEDYLSKLDVLFPGLGSAGADADAFVAAALASAVGVSYNEQVDSTPVDTAFLLAQREADARDRDALQAAAQAGHRFAHGHAMEAIARARGEGISTAASALSQVYAERLSQERSEKMRLVAAQLDTSMQRVRKVQEQVAELFRLKLQARGMWINDQNAVVDSVNNVYALNDRFDAQITDMVRRTATRKFGLDFSLAETKDRSDFLGKLKMANANEVVDLFGNMVTTLMNQVSGRGSYSGSERDVTDWDSLLA